MAARPEPAHPLADSLSRASPLAGLATVILVGAAVLAPTTWDGVLRAYLVVLGLLALWALLQTIRAHYPPLDDAEWRRALRPTVATQPPPEELVRLTSLVRFSAASGREVHDRLRPVLRAIATERLATRRGVDLAAQPEAARALLGEAAWELVRPDRPPPPSDRPTRGLPPSELLAMLDVVERI